MKLFDESGDNMAGFGVVVIVGPENITRHYGSERAPMLIMVGLVHHIYEPFCVTITKVGWMWRAVMNLQATMLTMGNVKHNYRVPTIVSSMGYWVLSGKMQVDRQDTTFFTPDS